MLDQVWVIDCQGEGANVLSLAKAEALAICNGTGRKGIVKIGEGDVLFSMSMQVDRVQWSKEQSVNI